MRGLLPRGPAGAAAAAVLAAALLLGFLLPADPLQRVHASGVVIVSGASTGIGRDAAVRLARRHAGLVVLAGVRRDADAAGVRGEGLPNLRPVLLDVTQADSVAEALRAAVRVGLPLVAVVNNAGVARGPTPVELHGLEDARALFEANFFGALRLTQAALPLLRASRGRVVVVSSIFGGFTPPQGGVYSASKRALEAVADALRMEASGLGVSVSIVSPGAVATPIFATLRSASIAAARAAGPEGSAAMRVYGHLNTAEDAANERRMEELAASTECTSDAIEHAVTAPRPRSRYLVANIVGAPAWLLTLVVRALPDRLADALLLGPAIDRRGGG